MNRRPTVLEIDTYRYYGHSVADANAKKYRDPEEIEKYRKFHDPLQLWQTRLLAEKVSSTRNADWRAGCRRQGGSGRRR